MLIDGCVHADREKGETICPACREMLRREQLDVGLQIVPTEERRRPTPPPFTPQEIERIERDDDVGVPDTPRYIH